MTDPLLHLLAEMRDRPVLYIGRCSVEALFLFLAGYRAALREHTDLDLSDYETFIEGLYERYGRGGGGHSWAGVLAEVAGNDAAGLQLFFEELEAFLRSLT